MTLPLGVGRHVTRAQPGERRAGILVPLFSIPSSQSWGIGEIPDVARLGHWLEAAGQNVLQVLPITEMSPGETSPYSAMSAMAIDPQFIAIGEMEDFEAIGGESSLDEASRRQLAALRASPTVRYAQVRQLKSLVLRRCFARFLEFDWRTSSDRAEALRAFVADEGSWLPDYALFRALHAHYGERPWTEWPEPLRAREHAAVAAAAIEFAKEVLFRQYLQWVAAGQWASVRDQRPDLALFGDLPFMVCADSADVWARQDEFRLDVTVGAPPDAFSDTGQEWSLPLYRWDVAEGQGFQWQQLRATRLASLFDGYRIDHLVGFFRTYFRPLDGSPARFCPDDEPAQRALGARLLEMFRASGAEIIAEDLGTVPGFVRDTLARLGVPGFKVFRWEREWHGEQAFIDPADYPRVSVATSGTHDTEPLAPWWEDLSVDDRRAVLAIPSVGVRLDDGERARSLQETAITPAVHHAVLESLYASGADLVLLPIQDVFGWADRINRPATVSEANWTWRLPWPTDRLAAEPAAVAVAARLREWDRRYRRSA